MILLILSIFILILSLFCFIRAAKVYDEINEMFYENLKNEDEETIESFKDFYLK